MLVERLNVCKNLTKALEQKKEVRGGNGRTPYSASRVLVYSNIPVFWQEAIMEGAKLTSGGKGT